MADTIPSTTTAQLAQRVSNLLDWAEARDDKWTAWVTGTPTGGPHSDGRYPLPYTDEEDVLVECPALLADMLVGPAAHAGAALAAAEAARDAAIANAEGTEADRLAAQAALVATVAARDLALTYRDQTGTLKSNAEAAADRAELAANSIGSVYADTEAARDAAQAAQAAAETKAAEAAADRAAVAADKATVAADKGTVAADKATALAAKDTAVQAAADAEADRASVAADKATVAADKTAVATAKADVLAAQTDITTKQTDVAAKAAQVTADKATVAADKAAADASKVAAQAAQAAAEAAAESVDGPILQAQIDAHEVRLDAIEANPLPKVEKPAGLSPANGATGLMDTVTFTGSVYRTLYGVAQSSMEVTLATDAGFTGTVQTFTAGAVQSLTLAAGNLATSTTYYWRVRYRDTDGVWSPHSAPLSFTTTAAFNVVAKPTAVSPATSAIGVPAANPTLTSSAFAMASGADTHAATHYQVATDSGFVSVVREETVAASTSVSVMNPALAFTTLYYWRVRYQGASGVWSPWSDAASFTTGTAYGSKTYTANGTFKQGVDCPPDVTQVRVIVIGGGGGGGSAWQSDDHGSGPNRGQNGGASSFGAFVTANGGLGGFCGGNNGGIAGALQARATATGGDTNSSGGQGARGNRGDNGQAYAAPTAGLAPFGAGGGGGSILSSGSTAHPGAAGGGDDRAGSGGKGTDSSLPTVGGNYGGGGGGGGGGPSGGAQGGDGGCGGAGAQKVCTLTAGQSVSVTVGSGGNGAVETFGSYAGIAANNAKAGAKGVVFIEWNY